jgi:hypothetical protein
LQLFLHPFFIFIIPLKPRKTVITSTSKPHDYIKLRCLSSKNQITKYILTKILKLLISLSLSYNNTFVVVKISLKTIVLNLLRIPLPNRQNFLVPNLKMLKPKPNLTTITLKLPTSLSLSHNNALVAVKISLKTTVLNLLRILLPNR